LPAHRPCRRPRPIDFRTDVIAALSRAGCNQGACHGSRTVRTVFASVFAAFDPDVDFTRSRAANWAGARSATAREQPVPAQGHRQRPASRRRAAQSREPAYEVLQRWVAEGCRDARPTVLEKLEFSPTTLRLANDTQSKQLTVRAHFKTGTIFKETQRSASALTWPPQPVTLRRSGL